MLILKIDIAASPDYLQLLILDLLFAFSLSPEP